MADPKTKRLTPKKLIENNKAGDALDVLTDYKPANNDFAKLEVQSARSDMNAKQTKEHNDYAAWLTSRDEATAAEWKYNDMIRGARTQVKAQYGENSNELQTMGLKKKSEYKSPTRTPKPKDE